MDLRKWI